MNIEDRIVDFSRPKLYAKQREAIFDPRRIALIEASTKSGKTSGCIAWLMEQAARGKPGQHFWWVAPVSMQADIAFQRMRAKIYPRDRYIVQLHRRSIVLNDSGAIIEFRSGDHPDTLYGEDVYACVIDEASRFKEQAWHAIRSTLTYTRGPIRIIGNVKGKKNWFYMLARRAEQGAPDLAYHRLTAYDAIKANVLAKDEIDEAQAIMPPAVFRELYLAEPGEDEGNPFGGAEAINACVGPVSRKPTVWWGWDLAKTQDWTVGVGLDRNGACTRFHRFRIPWHETVQWIKREVGQAKALIDSTGVGDPIVERLQREGCRNVEGYHFTNPSKQMLMEGLALAISSKSVTFPEGPIVIELSNFEYEYTRGGVRYSAPPGLHDDCVCALSLAVMARSRMPAYNLAALAS